MKHSFEIPITFFVDAPSVADAYKQVFDVLNRPGIFINWESGDQWVKDGEPVPDAETSKAILTTNIRR